MDDVESTTLEGGAPNPSANAGSAVSGASAGAGGEVSKRGIRFLGFSICGSRSGGLKIAPVFVHDPVPTHAPVSLVFLFQGQGGRAGWDSLGSAPAKKQGAAFGRRAGFGADSSSSSSSEAAVASSSAAASSESKDERKYVLISPSCLNFF